VTFLIIAPLLFNSSTATRTAFSIGASILLKKYASSIPMVKPDIFPVRFFDNPDKLLSTDTGSFSSKSAMDSSKIAVSLTVLAIGPTWSWVQDRGSTPCALTKSRVGFKPTTPHAAAGIRIDPAVSVPIDTGVDPTATEAADPPLEPPEIFSLFQGFRTGPKWGLSFVMLSAYSCMFNFPMMIAPASFSFVITVAL